MSFKKDLDNSKAWVEEVADHLKATIIEGYCKTGDIYFEVKEDLLAHRTGNVCFEYEYKGKPSGINTESKYIIYRVAGKTWICETLKLLARLEEFDSKVKIVKWWDWNQSSLKLIKIYDFIKIFDFLF